MTELLDEKRQKRRSLAMNPRRELSLNETTRHREKMQEAFKESTIPESPLASPTDPMPRRLSSASGTPPGLAPGGNIAVLPKRKSSTGSKDKSTRRGSKEEGAVSGSGERGKKQIDDCTLIFPTAKSPEEAEDQKRIQNEWSDDRAMQRILSTAFEVLGVSSDEQRAIFDTIVKHSRDNKRIQGLARVEKLNDIIATTNKHIEHQKKIQNVVVIQSFARSFLVKKNLEVYRLMQPRNKIFGQAMKSEKEYFDRLQNIVAFYYKPLLYRSKVGQAKIDPADVAIIFQNVEEVSELHRVLYLELQSYSQQAKTPSLSSIFRVMLSKFHNIYENYVQNGNYPIELLARAKTNNQTLVDFLNQSKDDSDFKTSVLEDLLVAPFSQIPNYIAYVKQMIEASPAREQLQPYKFFNTEEFFRLINSEKELLESLRRLQRSLESTQERSTDTVALLEINRKLSGYKIPTSAKGRRKLINRGELLMKKKLRTYFLLSDMMIIVKVTEEPETKSISFKYKMTIDFRDTVMKEVDADSLEFTNKGKKTLIAMPNPQKRKELSPLIQNAIKQTSLEGRVFGVELAELCRRDDAIDGIPFVVKCCTEFLLDGSNPETEGLFRVSGNAQHIKETKAVFDRSEGTVHTLLMAGPHTSASMMKEFFRELPEPLLTYKLYPEFMKADDADESKTLINVKKLVDSLPEDNIRNLAFLSHFLSKISESSEKSHMHSANLAIVFASNLLKPVEETKDTQFNVTRVNRIVQMFIDHKNDIFSSELLKACDEILKRASPKNLEPPPSPSTLRSSMSSADSNIVITLSRKTSGSVSARKGLSRKNTNDGISESSVSEASDLRVSVGSSSSDTTKSSTPEIKTSDEQPLSEGSLLEKTRRKKLSKHMSIKADKIKEETKKKRPDE